MDERVSRSLGQIRNLCSTAEYHLESHWASYIGDQDPSPTVYKLGTNHMTLFTKSFLANPLVANTRLEEFPYYDNYVDLTHMELSALSSVMPESPSRIAFIGSGPLPLSTLCILDTLKNLRQSQKLPNWSNTPSTSVKYPYILNVDRDLDATKLAISLCESLGKRTEGIYHQQTDATSHDLSLRNFHVVFLAALVGNSQEEKEVILMDIAGKMDVGSFVVIRTAHGLRTLLYPVSPSSAAILSVYFTDGPYFRALMQRRRLSQVS